MLVKVEIHDNRDKKAIQKLIIFIFSKKEFS